MAKKKVYYHIIEEGSHNKIASQGWFLTLKEAQAEVIRLKDFFHSGFYIWESYSSKEPEICTL